MGIPWGKYIGLDVMVTLNDPSKANGWGIWAFGYGYNSLALSYSSSIILLLCALIYQGAIFYNQRENILMYLLSRKTLFAPKSKVFQKLEQLEKAKSKKKKQSNASKEETRYISVAI